jgi:hypothetical protein
MSKKEILVTALSSSMPLPHSKSAFSTISRFSIVSS